MTKTKSARARVIKPKSITIRITDEIIEQSVREDSSKCMIAQALRFRGARSTHVTAESATFNLGETRYTYPLPAKAAVQLIKFDENPKQVKPFVFTLNGALAFSRPVIRNPNRKKRGPTKFRHLYKRCKRRFHGLRQLVAVEAG